MYGLRALVRDADDRWRAVATFQHDGERLAVRHVEITATDVLDVAAWRSFPLARVESQANVPNYYRLLLDHEHSTQPPEEVQSRRLRVGRFAPPPEGLSRYPNSFYQRVADVYLYHVEHGHPPAKRMAEDWNVEITKINRWVKRARELQFIPPARARGRAG